MSVERIFKWKCDFCPDVVEKAGYGLPPGYGWTKGKILQHGCYNCQQTQRDIMFYDSDGNKIKKRFLG